MRRRELLAKYGEKIRKLYGYDNVTAYQVIAVTCIQFAMAYAVRTWAWWQMLLAAWAVSGTLNQNLFSSQHEVGHYMAFYTPIYNKLLCIFSNCVLVVPVATKFREYHHDHHIFMGVDDGDVDLPTKFEGKWVRGYIPKFIYMFFYILVYAVRPILIRPKAIHRGDVVNWAIVITVDLLILRFWGFQSLLYLALGSLFAGGIHPLAGHLLAEHYVFEKGQETYSYYGPLNALTYNVGYHNEHHDFPQIPWTRLPRLREIAPEYYNHLYQHRSWCWVIYQFLFNPQIGPWSRIRRVQKEGIPESNKKYLESNCQYGVFAENEAAARAAVRATVTLAQSSKNGANGGTANGKEGGKGGAVRRVVSSENKPLN